MTAKLLTSDHFLYTIRPPNGSGRFYNSELANLLCAGQFSWTEVHSKHDAVVVFITEQSVIPEVLFNEIATALVGIDIYGPAVLCTRDQLPL